MNTGTARTGMKGSPLKVFDGDRLKSAKHFIAENGSLEMNTCEKFVICYETLF
jgi:hypothetical protein